MSPLRRVWMLASCALVLCACASQVPAPEMPLPGDQEAAEAWQRVLEQRVDDRGRIDFDGLRGDSTDLGTWVRWLGENGPRSTPGDFAGPEAQVAYYLNAYNGLALWNVLHAGVLPKDKLRFFGLRDLRVDGEWQSLYELENEVIRELGEPRVHFALNCMVRDCPRLLREPYLPERLEAQLDAAAREFLDDPRRVFLEDGRARVSPILTWYEEDFLAQAPSLIAYINRYRSEPLPADADIDALDYDWTLNAAPLVP